MRIKFKIGKFADKIYKKMPVKREDLRRVEVPQFSSRGGTGMGQLFPAYFHEWGKAPLPLDNGSYIEESIGIVELEDGTIKSYFPTNIRFVDVD